MTTDYEDLEPWDKKIIDKEIADLTRITTNFEEKRETDDQSTTEENTEW